MENRVSLIGRQLCQKWAMVFGNNSSPHLVLLEKLIGVLVLSPSSSHILASDSFLGREKAVCSVKTSVIHVQELLERSFKVHSRIRNGTNSPIHQCAYSSVLKQETYVYLYTGALTFVA